MSDSAKKPLLMISGPTASGKSGLAVKLAQALGGEIINMDSVQVYKEADIGSAKISDSEKLGIPHHLLDVFSPSEICTTGDYRKLATSCIQDLNNKGRLPIFVGGTTLYASTLLRGLAELPAADPMIRERLNLFSNQELHEKLQAADPIRAEQLHPNDRVRVIRALETIELSGSLPSEVFKEHASKSNDFFALIIVVCLPRDSLFEKIMQRTSRMLEEGLLDESRSIIKKYGANSQVFRSLGYAQALAYFEGTLSLGALAEEISMQTRRYAKRQMTFWRNEPIKRGWDVSPEQTPAGAPEQTRGKSLKSSKNFNMMELSVGALCEAVQSRLFYPFANSEVWYVDARLL